MGRRRETIATPAHGPPPPLMSSLRQLCLAALAACDPDDKLAKVAALASANTDVGSQARPDDPGHLPGRPPRPLLVSPRDVPQRSLGSVDGRAALLHALAHIEFNAIKIVFNECNPSPRTRKDEGSDGAHDAYGDFSARAESDARVLGRSFLGSELIAV